MSTLDVRLPDLRFVPVESVFPHEFHDPQRSLPLVERLRESGVLRNPPIVTQVGDEHRVEPRFDPAEVIELAGAGEHLPSGITRHLIQWRALRLNVPLDLCMDTEMPLERKNDWLGKWLGERLLSRQVRFYEEPTVMFDE